MSPISSRNSVPFSACSKRPRRVVWAPVKAPRSWPNNSDSSKSLGMAAVLSAMNGCAARGLCLCSARATSSLPVPDSPVISTVTFDCDSRPMARNTSCMAGAWPRISGVSDGPDSTLVSRKLSSRARRISSTALSMSKGLARYSKAPPWKAATAESRSENAVMIITGKPGKRDLTSCSKSSPESPGMRMSDTSTCGVSTSSAAIASRALEKLLVTRFSLASAFSSTQRIDSSSSTIQIGFMSYVYPAIWIVYQGSGTGPAGARLWQGQQDAEVRVSRPALAFDHAHVLLHEGLRQSQPQAAAALPPRHQRVENAIANLGGDARSIVDDMQV